MTWKIGFRRAALVSVAVFSAMLAVSSNAATPYEPPGFTPPPNLLQAIQKAKAKNAAPLPLPSGAPPLPTLGVSSQAFKSPWARETEFGDAAKIANVDTNAKKSALQGGTTMMLSTLPTAVGRIEASYGVSPIGAAQYTIPIWTPPGVRGIEPHLALAYSSNTSDTLFGPGWSLQGLSVITRCPKTWAQDQVAGPISLTLDDKFCLDGNRLRLTSGTYGVAGSTYQTELETFSRVTAQSTAGNGPAWFKVEGKDGLIYEYGNTADSRITAGVTTPYLWALNKVSDRNGNFLTISYWKTNGAFRPNVIAYTQTATTTPHYAVTFVYDDRTSITNLNEYVSGGQVQQTKVMIGIEISHDASLVRKYNIDYSTSPITGRPLVSAVQTCSPTDCLKPTTVTYQTGSIGVSTPSNAVSFPGFINSVDVNGDGRSDMVYFSGSNYWVSFATSSGFATGVDTGIPIGSAYRTFDDFLGNGKIGLLAQNGTNWYYTYWNGSAFTSINTGLAVDTSISSLRFASADVNNDGLPDLVWLTNTGAVYYLLNSGSGSTVSFTGSSTLAANVGTVTTGYLIGNYNTPNSSVRKFDFDGNGTDDVLYVNNGAPRVLLTRTTSSFTVNTLGSSGFGIPVMWNDDSCTDFILTTDRAVAISACNGAGPTTVALPNHPDPYGPALDWNGDGRTDVMVKIGSNWNVYLSTGESYSGPTSTSITSFYIYPFDQDGDGLDDLMRFDGFADVTSWGLHNGAGSKPDLATNFVDGFEMQASFSYKPINASGACYARDAGAPSFPAIAYMGPLYVACTMTASDGTGGIYTQAQAFFNANSHLQGRGFLGFERHYFVDSRNGLVNMDVYGQLFPIIGMKFYSATLQSDWMTMIRKNAGVVNTLSFGTGLETRSFPYLNRTDEELYELGGALNGQWIKNIRTDITLDSYGNPTTTLITTIDESTASPYHGETYKQTLNQYFEYSTGGLSNWCVRLPYRATRKSELPDTTSQTRRTDYAVDYISCRTEQEVVEPLSSTLKVTTTYGFDTCGNVNSVQIVGKNPNGANMAARTTSSSYGTRCHLPESITDASGKTSTATYNYDFGLPSSRTDPNKISVSWLYDGYGRKTRENKPDSTTTTWTLYACDTSNSYCGVSDLRFQIRESEINSLGSLMRFTDRYMDGFDRLRYHEPQNLTGGTTYEIQTFDSLGRPYRSYMPTTGATNYRQYSYDLIGRLTNEALYKSGGIFDRQTTTAYAGQQIILTDANGNATTKYIDVRNNLRRVVDPSTSDNTYFTYDYFNNLVSTTDPTGAISTMTYDAVGYQAVSSSDPDRGSWTFEFDSLGELINVRDAKTSSPNWTLQNTYDELGRLVSRTQPEGTSSWNWGTSAVAKNIGKLECVVASATTACNDGNNTYREVYTYDATGRLQNTSIRIPSDGIYDIDYAYNSTTGLLDNITYPPSTSGYRLRAQYQYQYGILNQIRDYNAPSTIWWQLNAEDARGNPVDEQFGNGVHVVSENDDLTGHLNWRTSGNNGQYNNHQNISYEWDKNENLKKRIDLNQSSLTEEFFYDALDRLDYSTLNGVTNLDVTLSAAGNITYKSDVGSFDYTTAQSGCSYYTHTQPHAVRNAGGVIYCYDANGNMVKRNGATTTWYSYNLPNSISNGTDGSQFFYTPDRNRWKQLASYGGVAEDTLYIGGLMEKVLPGSGGTIYRHYIPAGSNTIVYTRRSTGTHSTYYATSDHLGSSSVVTDQTGAVIVKESFEAYGKRRGTNWTGSPSSGDLTAIAGTTRHGFTGHEHLDNLSLIHMNGRVFDPVIGRFMSADPFIDWGLGSQGLNPYSYVGNKPLSFTDPTGFISGNETEALCTPSGPFVTVFCNRNDIENILGSLTRPSNNPVGYGVLQLPEVSQGTITQQFVERRPSIAEALATSQREIDELQKALLLGHEAKPIIERPSPWRQMGSDLLTVASWFPLGRTARILGAARAVKAVNLPAWKKVGIDMGHVLERHTASGPLAAGRTTFPELMNEKGIERAIREAYRYGEKIGSQGDRVLMQGTSGGMTIEMWVNRATGMIETAYPVIR